jgi:uncharacterized protein involved in response to NO
MWLGGHIGSVPVALLDLLYLTALGLCVANEIVAGRNGNTAPVPIALALLVAANALFIWRPQAMRSRKVWPFGYRFR